MDGSTAAYPVPHGRPLGGRGDAPPDGLIDEVTREVRNATSDLHEITAALAEHLDFTLGHNPKPAGNGAKPNSETPIRADQLRMSLSVLRSAISELREQVGRARQI